MNNGLNFPIEKDWFICNLKVEFSQDSVFVNQV